jgi:methylenetetrahydrofolate--tRNA-(uracil-5-)-methyltransferase
MVDRAQGLLKEEIRRLNSMLLRCAEKTAIPAGGALAVDRETFSKRVTEMVCGHPRIHLMRGEATEIPPGPAVIASGPLTSNQLSGAIAQLTGLEHLFFYDAIAPVVYADSINMNVAFRASRYGRGESEEGDYINCPFSREEYYFFVENLRSGDRIDLKDYELQIEKGVDAGAHIFFEGCLPVEVLAQRGKEALAFGPMRPAGIHYPDTRIRPYAVIQLRQDNFAGTLYNLVGFQTNLKFEEQKRIFRMIPGLERAEFARFGQMHRNTFIYSPTLLLPTLQFRQRKDLFFAGQITGIEGYVGNIATGLLAGWNAARVIQDSAPLELPRETMLGSLCAYITGASAQDFQPMKANFGILPVLENLSQLKGKNERNAHYSRRSLEELERFLQSYPLESCEG